MLCRVVERGQQTKVVGLRRWTETTANKNFTTGVSLVTVKAASLQPEQSHNELS